MAEKICDEAEIEAVMTAIKKEFDELKFPQEIVDFDNDLWDLAVKRLMKVPIEEVERFYGDRTLVDLIQVTIEMEKKYPDQGTL